MENYDKYQSFRIAVPHEFEEVCSHFYFSENLSTESITQTLVPSFQTILIFNFGPAVTIHTQQNTTIDLIQFLVLGPIKKAFDYSLPPQSKILVANFKGDAFYRFFGISQLPHHVPQQNDEHTYEHCFSTLWHNLKGMKSAQDQVNFFLHFCQPYFQKQSPLAKQLMNVNDAAIHPVKLAAQQFQQTERNIQLHHKKYFGFSAKEFHRYQRFLKALQLVERFSSKASKDDWFEVVARCGYFDQSQLIHDFQFYLGISPSKYLKLHKEICHPVL